MTYDDAALVLTGLTIVTAAAALATGSQVLLYVAILEAAMVYIIGKVNE